MNFNSANSTFRQLVAAAPNRGKAGPDPCTSRGRG